MVKIVVTGPESSGKTTLVNALSLSLAVPIVQEMARPYLRAKEGAYEEEDLRYIARAQVVEEGRIAALRPRYLLCDTDLLTIVIWSKEKYGRVHSQIVNSHKANPADIYLLCTPDIPWEPDPLREHPEERERLFQYYSKALVGLNHVVLHGTRQDRLAMALKHIGK